MTTSGPDAEHVPPSPPTGCGPASSVVPPLPLPELEPLLLPELDPELEPELEPLLLPELDPELEPELLPEEELPGSLPFTVCVSGGVELDPPQASARNGTTAAAAHREPRPRRVEIVLMGNVLSSYVALECKAGPRPA